MAITQTGSGTRVGTDDGNARAHGNWPVTIPSDSEIVYISFHELLGTGTDRVTAVTLGGQGMTKVGEDVNSTRYCVMYRLVSPPTGSQTFVITATTGATRAVNAWRAYKGIDTGDPVGTANTANGDSGSASVTVSSATGELVVDAVSCNNATLTMVANGRTQEFNTSDLTHHGAGSRKDGAASVTMNWTLSVSERWAIVAEPMKPGAGAVDASVLCPTENLLTVRKSN